MTDPITKSAEPASLPQSGSAQRKKKKKKKPEQALLYVQDLNKAYPRPAGLFRKAELSHALHDVNFYIRHRETIGLVGESGCGKTTLAMCILRLIEPTMGRVLFDGKEVTTLRSGELRQLRRRMQIVFQDPYASLNPHMTVRDLVAEGIEVFGLAASKHSIDDMAGTMLERVGLSRDAMTRYPHAFSGGERQRIAIARALAVSPDFLVLDEPLSALDLSVQAQIINLLDDLQQKLNLTQLFISHDLRAVQYVSHRMAIMHLGRIVEMGPSSSVAKDRFHPYTRALFTAMASAPSEGGDENEPRKLPIVNALADEISRGCAYASRCERQEERCHRERPVLREIEVGSHHRVACWQPYLES